MSDFETVPRGTLEKLEAVKAERDALVAHVEGLRDALKHLRHNAYHSGAEMGLALEVADDALSEPQLTSLARMKAQWQAEALDRCAKGVAACKPGATPQGISIAIKVEANELRRQAEDD